MRKSGLAGTRWRAESGLSLKTRGFAVSHDAVAVIKGSRVARTSRSSIVGLSETYLASATARCDIRRISFNYAPTIPRRSHARRCRHRAHEQLGSLSNPGAGWGSRGVEWLGGGEACAGPAPMVSCRNWLGGCAHGSTAGPKPDLSFSSFYHHNICLRIIHPLTYIDSGMAACV